MKRQTLTLPGNQYLYGQIKIKGRIKETFITVVVNNSQRGQILSLIDSNIPAFTCS